MIQVISKSPTLIDLGYQVIPITTGTVQKPLVTGHLRPETEYTVQDAESWVRRYPEAGVALCAGKNDVYSLDFDIDDLFLSKQLLRILKKKWPELPIRMCNKPRFAIVFKASACLCKYSNAHSNGYKHKGNLNQIELIGNRIITLFGEHRKTGNRYRWLKYNPCETPVSNLPELTAADVTNIFKFYEKRVHEDSKLVIKSTFRKPKSQNTFENIRISRKFSEKEVKDLLTLANGDERESWIEVGMALHNHYNGSEKGLDIWDDWSSKFDKYKGVNDCRQQWKSFTVGGGITLSAIENRVIDITKPIDIDPEQVMQDVLKNFVYIEKTNQVGILSRSVTESLLMLQNARNSYSNVFVERKVKHRGTNKDLIKHQNVIDVWWKHPQRKLAHAEDYVPMNSRLIHPDHWNDDSRKMTYYNSYIPPSTKLTNGKELLNYFIEHIKYIFPGNFEIVMNWFAQIVQKPWERHRVALYSICTNQGTGRGWLVELTSLLFGTKNVSTIGSMEDIIKPNAKNGYLYRTVLVNVNEVSCRGDSKYKISDRLKTLLSDNRQAIDIKWGAQDYGVEIYTRMFASANSIGDMVIDENDNRFTVCISHAKPKATSYYVKLYQLLDRSIHPDFVNQVYTYLMKWNVDVSLLQAAPMTKDKITVIKANKTETALAFYEFKTIVGGSLFTNKTLNDFISEYNAVYHSNNPSLTNLLNEPQLKRLMKDQYKTHEIRRIKTSMVQINSFNYIDVQNIDVKKIIKSFNISKKKVKRFFINLTTEK